MDLVSGSCQPHRKCQHVKKRGDRGSLRRYDLLVLWWIEIDIGRERGNIELMGPWRFGLWAAGEVAQCLFNDEATTERLLKIARRRAGNSAPPVGTCATANRQKTAYLPKDFVKNAEGEHGRIR